MLERFSVYYYNNRTNEWFLKSRHEEYRDAINKARKATKWELCSCKVINEKTGERTFVTPNQW